MIVTFTELDEFLTDLKSEVGAAGEHVDDGIVRIALQRMKPNHTTTEYALAAGFSSLGELRQLELHCGTDFAPDTEGEQAANAVISQIEAFCKEANLTVRGGRFQSE